MKVKKGDTIVITKDVYYYEHNMGGGLSTEPPIVWMDKGTVMTALDDGVFEDVEWNGGGRETVLWLDWIS